MIVVALSAIPFGGASILARQLSGNTVAWEDCPWTRTSHQDGQLQCFDGTHCEGIDCCSLRQGPARCPPGRKMCARPHDCAGGNTRCCEEDCGVHGGERECGSRCYNVAFQGPGAGLPEKGIFVMSSGVHERLPDHCTASCSITVCGQKVLKIVNPQDSQAWQANVAVDGVRLPKVQLLPGTEMSFDFDSLKAPTWFNLGSGCCEGKPDGQRANFLRSVQIDEMNMGKDSDACKTICSETVLPQPCTYFEVGGGRCYLFGGMCYQAPWERPSKNPASGKLSTCTRETFERIQNHAWIEKKHEEVRQCYPEEEWREQSWLNYTGIFQRCGTQGICNADMKCVAGCAADEQCERYPFQLCKMDESVGENRCQHKDLFEYDAVPDSVTAIAFFVISGLALSAGIGGGGLYVPLLMICLGFKTKAATGLSQALLSGGASSALVYNMRQKHPSGTRPMVDYSLASIMCPMLVIGALLGSTLNQAAPSWLILVLLTLILGDASNKTIRKALKTLREERKGNVKGMKANTRLSKNPIAKVLSICGIGRYQNQMDDANASTPKGSTHSEGPSPEVVGKKEVDMAPAMKLDQIDLQMTSGDSGGTGSSEVPIEVEKESEASHSQEPLGPLADEKPQFPKGELAILACVWVTVLTAIFLRGGKGTKGAVENCSGAYWIITCVCCGVLFLVGGIAVARAVSSQKGAELVDGEVEWTWPVASRLAAWSLMAGCLAALCGIGGGMVMGPKLLNMGFLPQVQSATTATTLFILSTSAAAAFLVAGSAPIDYAAFLATATALGAIFGKAVISYLVKLYRRPSIIIFILAFIITASVIIMTINGIIDVVNDAESGASFGFIDPCGDEPSVQ